MSVYDAMQTAYRGPFKRAVQAFGLEPVLSRLYWRRRLRSAPDTYELTVNEAAAAFYITNRWEYGAVIEFDEWPALSEFIDVIQPGDVVWDVGANIGIYSCLAASAGAEVVAFEPEPTNRRRLTSNVALNDTAIEIRVEALAAEPGTATLGGDPVGDEPGRGRHALGAGEHPSEVEVDVDAADRLIERGEVDPPAVMKIDVEGGELSVLRGAERLLNSESCRCVLVEVHPSELRGRCQNVAEVFSILNESGFSVNVIDERDGQPFVHATK